MRRETPRVLGPTLGESRLGKAVVESALDASAESGDRVVMVTSGG